MQTEGTAPRPVPAGPAVSPACFLVEWRANGKEAGAGEGLGGTGEPHREHGLPDDLQRTFSGLGQGTSGGNQSLPFLWIKASQGFKRKYVNAGRKSFVRACVRVFQTHPKFNVFNQSHGQKQEWSCCI